MTKRIIPPFETNNSEWSQFWVHYAVHLKAPVAYDWEEKNLREPFLDSGWEMQPCTEGLEIVESKCWESVLRPKAFRLVLECIMLFMNFLDVHYLPRHWFFFFSTLITQVCKCNLWSSWGWTWPLMWQARLNCQSLDESYLRCRLPLFIECLLLFQDTYFFPDNSSIYL